MSNIERMRQLAFMLTEAGFYVTIPEEADIDWNALTESESVRTKQRFIDNHLASISNADVVLIANFPKNDQSGYIGANVLMEIAFAYALRKPVVLLFDPATQDCRLEVLSVASRILDGEVDDKFLQEGI